MHHKSDHGGAPAQPDTQIRRAARILRNGGVLAYPTESVYGLGCLPGNQQAVARVLELKGRTRLLGLILIAAEWRQFDGWAADLSSPQIRPELRGSRGITWVVPAANQAPGWITGGRNTIALRRSLHPFAAALSRAVDSPLVSTSCNPHGRPPARTALAASNYFGAAIDWAIPGECGPLPGPTEIRDGTTGELLRPSG